MAENEVKSVRKVSVLSALDFQLIITYLKIGAYKRTENIIEYIKSLLCRMKIHYDIQQGFLEDCQKELAMYFKLLPKGKNEIIPVSPCDIYIVLQGEVAASSETNTILIKEGGYIGEPCLLFPNISQYSVRCFQPCLLAHISYQVFCDICQRHSLAYLDQTASLIRQIPIFQDWGHRSLVNFVNSFRLISLERHNYLFEEGEDCEYVYIIKSGELYLSKAHNTEKIKIFNVGKYGRPLNLPETKHKNKANVICSIKSNLEVIGNEEVANGLKWKYSCKCKSFVSTLFRISKNDYKKNIRFDELPQILHKNDEIVSSRLQKSISILNITKRTTSLPSPNPEIKIKVLNNLKKLDPWCMNKNLVLTYRDQHSSILNSPREKNKRDTKSTVNLLYSSGKKKD